MFFAATPRKAHLFLHLMSLFFKAGTKREEPYHPAKQKHTPQKTTPKLCLHNKRYVSTRYHKGVLRTFFMRLVT
jgi:hypothetical protein